MDLDSVGARSWVLIAYKDKLLRFAVEVHDGVVVWQVRVVHCDRDSAVLAARGEVEWVVAVAGIIKWDGKRGFTTQILDLGH